MPLPINDLQRHIAPLKDMLSGCARQVIESGYYVLGPGVAQFEAEFARYCGAAHCIGVANGTDALELALKAVGVEPGDCVGVVANAAMYGSSAVLASHARPVFVDVEPETANMSPAHLQDVLSSQKLRAVIVTHLYGRLARIHEILEICAQHGVAVVEDCAQAHGARLDGRAAGSFGDAAAFSFYPTKNLGALGDGGAVVTSSDEIAERTRRLRQYGWTAKYTNSFSGGRNSRLDELQAHMLLKMLPLLDGWNERRREIANFYSANIKTPKIWTPAISGKEYVGHLYVIQTEHREALRAHLQASRIQTDIHYPLPDYRQPCHEGAYESIHLPVTEKLAKTVLTLPCFPELSNEEAAQVVAACNQF
ncbi:erythromycin biosynthesis sensory transduction protein eryC1 [Lysobacteraceae bacterium NML75-0749]|nr:erythromycin biosynthesis sensory transduction protein eryC1 [Xanthomonadaceae bacterium NML75-0749]PJK03663.1 erythromycin biosynthesis sensory transduction protein eryC1 [Xanthomonadaceae bacterium NML91-0268]